jgi:DNA-directed RNA polymerase specialized sigma24 family protein
LIIEILPIIEQVCKDVIKNEADREDFQQDFIIKCYSIEAPLRIAVRDNKTKYFLWTTANNFFKDRNKRRKLCTVDIDPANIELTDATELKYLNIKTHKELLDQLPSKDRVFIQRYIECGMNKLEMKRVTGINCLTIRRKLDKIYDKWKQLDIYLPQ